VTLFKITASNDVADSFSRVEQLALEQGGKLYADAIREKKASFGSDEAAFADYQRQEIQSALDLLYLGDYTVEVFSVEG
jgi:hypothetical protein